MLEEDPTVKEVRDPDTKEDVLYGYGDIHLDVLIEKMKRKFGVEVGLAIPKVPYKETIKGTTKVEGKYKRQSGGRGQYGHCWLELEPLPVVRVLNSSIKLSVEPFLAIIFHRWKRAFRKQCWKAF